MPRQRQGKKAASGTAVPEFVFFPLLGFICMYVDFTRVYMHATTPVGTRFVVNGNYLPKFTKFLKSTCTRSARSDQSDSPNGKSVDITVVTINAAVMCHVMSCAHVC